MNAVLPPTGCAFTPTHVPWYDKVTLIHIIIYILTFPILLGTKGITVEENLLVASAQTYSALCHPDFFQQPVHVYIQWSSMAPAFREDWQTESWSVSLSAQNIGPDCNIWPISGLTAIIQLTIGARRINPNGFGDWLTFPLAPFFYGLRLKLFTFCSEWI